MAGCNPSFDSSVQFCTDVFFFSVCGSPIEATNIETAKQMLKNFRHEKENRTSYYGLFCELISGEKKCGKIFLKL